MIRAYHSGMFENKSIGITTNHMSSKLKLSKRPEASANDQNC